jgi:hypothetical protein
VWDWILLVLGAALGILALTADVIGIGVHRGFGRWQGVAAAVALVLVVLSAVRIARRQRP